MAGQELPKGILIEDKYKVDSLIGEGGLSKTYLAEDQETGKDVVLKTLSFDDIKDWKELELFEREIDILKNLDNSNIPDYYSHFKFKYNEEEIFVLVQEHVKGKNLYDLISGGKHFTNSQVRDILKVVLEVLVYIHRLNPPVIHRDITPKNVILDENNKVYLVDFGAVGKLVDSTMAAAMSNTFVGTIGYMPPEQLFGKATPASDLYSLGATVIFLLTGKQPSDFELDNMKIDFEKHVNIPKPFVDLISKMIEPDYKKRIDDAKRALNMLSDIIIVDKKSHEDKKKSRGKKKKDSEVDDEIENQFNEKSLSGKLYKAVSARDINYVKRLIEQGADCSQINPETGLAPLHVAAEKGYLRLTETLLEYCDVNIQAKDGKTPIVIAMENKNFDIVALLKRSNADINVRYGGKAMIHHACRNQKYDLVNILINYKADINLEDDNGKTPLEYAYDKNNISIEDLLIENGAVVNTDTYGRALLENAIAAKDSGYVKKLINEGADVNGKLREGMYPLEKAIFTAGSKTIVQMLINNGVDMNVRSQSGDTLFNEVIKKKKNFVDYFIDNGADVNNKTKNGDTPLLTAIKNKKREVVKKLIDKGCDVDLPGVKDMPPILVAYETKSYDILRMLAEAGADLNVKEKGLAILHKAVIENNKENVKLLIDAEAYLDVRDENNGKTPLQYAYERDFYEVKNMLIEAGADQDFDFKVTNKYKDLTPPPRKLRFIDKYRLLINKSS